jgi:hypothetical protein
LFQTLLKFLSESADFAISFTGLIFISQGFEALNIWKIRLSRLKDFKLLVWNLERSSGDDSQGKLRPIDKRVDSGPGFLSSNFFSVMFFSSQRKQSMLSLKLLDFFP